MLIEHWPISVLTQSNSPMDCSGWKCSFISISALKRCYYFLFNILNCKTWYGFYIHCFWNLKNQAGWNYCIVQICFRFSDILNISLTTFSLFLGGINQHEHENLNQHQNSSKTTYMMEKYIFGGWVGNQTSLNIYLCPNRMKWDMGT